MAQVPAGAWMACAGRMSSRRNPKVVRSRARRRPRKSLSAATAGAQTATAARSNTEARKRRMRHILPPPSLPDNGGFAGNAGSERAGYAHPVFAGVVRLDDQDVVDDVEPRVVIALIGDVRPVGGDRPVAVGGFVRRAQVDEFPALDLGEPGGVGA